MKGKGIHFIVYKDSALCYLILFLMMKEKKVSEGSIMKKKDKENFKEHLTERLKDLLNQAGNTVSGMTETKENFPDPVFAA